MGASVDIELANYLASDDRKRAELTFRLVLSLAKENEAIARAVRAHDERLARHGKRLALLEQAAFPSRPRDPADTGNYELETLRDDRKWWRRLAVTTAVTIVSSLAIAGVVAIVRIIFAKGGP